MSAGQASLSVGQEWATTKPFYTTAWMRRRTTLSTEQLSQNWLSIIAFRSNKTCVLDRSRERKSPCSTFHLLSNNLKLSSLFTYVIRLDLSFRDSMRTRRPIEMKRLNDRSKEDRECTRPVIVQYTRKDRQLKILLIKLERIDRIRKNLKPN